MPPNHTAWNNQPCAISLTYDDALNVHEKDFWVAPLVEVADSVRAARARGAACRALSIIHNTI